MFTKPLCTKGDCKTCHHLKSLYSVFPLKQQTLAATIYSFLICSQPIISLRMHLINKDASSRRCLCVAVVCALGKTYFCLPFCVFISSTVFVNASYMQQLPCKHYFSSDLRVLWGPSKSQILKEFSHLNPLVRPSATRIAPMVWVGRSARVKIAPVNLGTDKPYSAFVDYQMEELLQGQQS